MITALLLGSGLVLLYLGADWFVKGSSSLAFRFGVPSLVVGLTVVAFGTSAPELAVSVRAGYEGIGDMAIGNVVGSNIFNIAVILGLSAIIRPLRMNIEAIRTDAPIVLAVSLLLWGLLFNGTIGRFEGVLLIGGLALYTAHAIYAGRKNSFEPSGKESIASSRRLRRPIVLDLLAIMLGFGFLLLGSLFFVKGAVAFARILNISEAVIGLTIMAAGTSMPELATSLVAAAKGEEDIAIGNILGSNIFNILAVLGISSALTPLHAQGIGRIDLLFMCAAAAILLPFMRTGFRLSRTEGAALLLFYSGYMWYLWP
ncbi:calcium/sodium antiporter [Fibrobacterota bacterium]